MAADTQNGGLSAKPKKFDEVAWLVIISSLAQLLGDHISWNPLGHAGRGKKHHFHKRNNHLILLNLNSWKQLTSADKLRWLSFWWKLCFLPLPAWPWGFQLMWFTYSQVRLEKMANHATSSTFLGAAERPPFWVSAAKIWGETVSWFISCSQSIFPISWHLSADMHQKWCDILWSKFANVSLMFWATWSQNFIQFCLAVFEIGRGEPRKRSTL